ncbi:MAG: hypothetical protein ACJA2S_004748 [Cyclobacteriaceae bacterium]|jgi:hypothetical protein
MKIKGVDLKLFQPLKYEPNFYSPKHDNPQPAGATTAPATVAINATPPVATVRVNKPAYAAIRPTVAKAQPISPPSIPSILSKLNSFIILRF